MSGDLIRRAPANDVMPEPADYWRDTDRALAICRHRDRQVAAAMNAEHHLVDGRTPFGSRVPA